jgi:transaldolase
MKATRKLHDAGQSLWLDNITRSLLTGGTLSRSIGELSVTGLTSNPTVFGAELQRDGATAFVASWKELLACLVEKSTNLRKAG